MKKKMKKMRKGVSQSLKETENGKEPVWRIQRIIMAT